MSYLKGKDIKTQGDCLVHYFIKKIETQFMDGDLWIPYYGRHGKALSTGYHHISTDGFYVERHLAISHKPSDFHKW